MFHFCLRKSNEFLIDINLPDRQSEGFILLLREVLFKKGDEPEGTLRSVLSYTKTRLTLDKLLKVLKWSYTTVHDHTCHIQRNLREKEFVVVFSGL